jgi:hypothetical protein
MPRDRWTFHDTGGAARRARGALRHLACALAMLLVVAPLARADTAMVLVESVSAPVPNVAAFDYVVPGTTIDLGSATVIVLDHLANCVRETVTGGVLHVGAQTSQDDGGSIARSRVACDGPQLQQDASRQTAGVAVYRDMSDPLILHTTAPLVVAAEGGTLRFDRTDQPGPPIELTVPAPAPGEKTRIDLATAHVALTQGANYTVSLGPNKVMIKIAPDAKGVDAPLLARLLPI